MTTNNYRAEDYFFGRNFLSSCRLTGQDSIFAARSDSFITPDIEAYLNQQSQNDQPISIADQACGNGLWAFQAARQFLHAEVVGFDISAAQFPPVWVRPKNVTLDVLDLFAEDTPRELHSKFDVVHIRLVRNVIPDLTPQKMDLAFKNILTILKPTGYLQWDEVVHPYFNIHHPNATDATTTVNGQDLPSFFATIDQCRNNQAESWRSYDWLESMRQVGFQYQEVLKFPVLPEMLFYESGYVQWVVQEFIDNGRRLLPPEKVGLLDKAQLEIDGLIAEGLLLSQVMNRYVGRKGSSS